MSGHTFTGFGPGLYIIEFMYVAVAVLALVMVFDAMRPLRTRRLTQIAGVTGQSREPLALYQVLGGLFVLLVVAAMFPVIPSLVKMLAVFGTPVTVIVEVMYLLRVVFPKVPYGTCIDWGTDECSTSPCDTEER